MTEINVKIIKKFNILSGGGHSLQTNGFSGAAWYGRGSGAGGYAGA